MYTWKAGKTPWHRHSLISVLQCIHSGFITVSKTIRPHCLYHYWDHIYSWLISRFINYYDNYQLFETCWCGGEIQRLLIHKNRFFLLIFQEIFKMKGWLGFGGVIFVVSHFIYSTIGKGAYHLLQIHIQTYHKNYSNYFFFFLDTNFALDSHTYSGQARPIFNNYFFTRNSIIPMPIQQEHKNFIEM